MQKTTYTIIIKHLDYSTGMAKNIKRSFELPNHAAAVEYANDNYSPLMTIQVYKEVKNSTTRYYKLETSPVTSPDLPKYVQAKVKHLLAFVKAELNTPSEPKALSAEDQADYNRQIAAERNDGCMDDPKDKIQEDIEASVQSHSETEKTVPSFGPEQYDEYIEYETKQTKRSGCAFNISADQWDIYLEEYAHYTGDNGLHVSDGLFIEFLEGYKELAPFIQVARNYGLTVDELVDIKEQFQWFCDDFGYNVQNQSLFHSYITHWKSVNHANNKINQ